MSALVLSDAELIRLRTLLAGAAGLVFEDSRRESLGFCVSERLRATGRSDVPSYLDEVERAGTPELQALIDEVTIQETHFFRNPPQVRALREHVLPELVRAAETRGRRLRVWSAGCSTGEEPYTIAMMLRELLPSTAGWDVKVLGTDISTAAVAAARSATYGKRALQLATPDQLTRFFVPTADGRHQVRPEIRELVELRHHNLVTEPPPGDGLDLVLCRNVTIYFSRETTRSLMARLHTALHDGGYLFLGHSETLWQVSEDFRLVTLGTGDTAAFVYRRRDPRTGGGERRAVLPDRRTRQELPLPSPQRRIGSRRTLPAPVHALPALLEPVHLALAEGRYADAARLARLAADVEPMRAQVHYLLGRALTDLGLHDEALPALRRAVYLAPDDGQAHFLLAGALERSGDPVAAAREYRAAAGALGREPAATTAPELGGRSVRELAALCAQLEGRLTGGTP